jgi:soluble lytic murein transglycosylase-like protein
LPKPFFRGKNAVMLKNPSRLLLVFALALTGMGSARAALPKHPPAPPARPVFDDDAAYLQQAAAEAALAQQQAQDAAFPAFFAPAPQPEPQSEPQAAVAPEGPPPSSVQAYAAPEAPQAAPFDRRRDRKTADSAPGFDLAEKAGLAEVTRDYARRHGVPLALLHRVIMRESKYCPRLVHRSYYGLMQITPATARSMGYKGSPQGLLDARTNLAYATPYLANAWALADGDMDKAVRLYASGYYYTAKSKKMLGQMRHAESPPADLRPVATDPARAYQAAPQDPFAASFAAPTQ